MSVLLKNKTERENFIRAYKEWELLYDLEEIKVKIYKKVLNTGTVIYATEFEEYIGYKKEFTTGVRYHLLLDPSDEFKTQSCCGYEYQVTYNPNGCSIGTIVDYMTKNRDVLEV